jgi:hypothetical protein
MFAARMLIFCSLAALVLAGCSKTPTALNQVTGKVHYKGAPLRSGLIVFSPDVSRGENGKIAISKIKEDGSYTLITDDAPGVKAGWYRVTVASLSTTSTSFDTPAVSVIPVKYSDPKDSQLQCEVKANRDNHLDFNLD